ncbi:alcohol dehydrogenase [Nakamurella antarctica]|uniref:Alcohol dehydrogenase n=1 Tax=Nakamurella antarctica TaxID=1902245 RepID=A0A3G8ZYR5_9ACTN|nr:zinc-dependent alcohol dehydrogenase family protein [Nakamurella antarctica]AZI59166.1 alcohol dehydrogenase [Nakamurella antarctica]
MQALVFDAINSPLHLRDVPPPACPDDGALIAVRASGVCRSDWHAWQGHDPVALPHIPGHELAGVIAQVGSSVRRWKPGDRVTVPFVCGCGACEYCLAGDSQVCPDQTQPGFTHAGSFAELVAIHRADFNLVALPEAIDFVTAAALGCRFATAFRALTAHGGLTRGQWVAVHGCGGVGLSAVMIAKALGANVIAVDISEQALRTAANLGADITLMSSPRAAAQIQQQSGGVHVSIDALGSAETAVASVLSLRRRGKHIQIGLLLGASSTPPLPMGRVVAWELSIHGSHGMAAQEYPAMLAMIADGRLDPSLLVGRTVGLADGSAALAAMGQPGGGPGMTVIEIG